MNVEQGKPNPKIFDYEDYRVFLVDVIHARRKRIKKYTRKNFAKAIGFASDAGLNMVLSRKRELRAPFLDRCIRNLRLPMNERLYFEAMVRAGNLTPSKRRKLLRDLKMLSNDWETPKPQKGIRLIDFFIVQQLLCLRHCYVTAQEITQGFRYPITKQEVQKVLSWMFEHKYVEERNGTYRITKTIMMAKDEYTDKSLRQIHHDAFKLAGHALENDPVDEREFQTYFFTVDTKKIGEMKKRIKRMVLEVVSEYETEIDADSVVQMHFNLIEVVRKNSTTTGDRAGELQ